MCLTLKASISHRLGVIRLKVERKCIDYNYYLALENPRLFKKKSHPWKHRSYDCLRKITFIIFVVGILPLNYLF